MCWYCYWGWPKPIAEIYLAAKAKLNGDESALDYGPAHIVWADCNWHCTQWCLDNFETYKGDLDDEALSIVRWSLEELVKIDLEACDPMPSHYIDGEALILFPPTKPVVHV